MSSHPLKPFVIPSTSVVVVLLALCHFDTTSKMNWKSEVPDWCNSTITKSYLLKMDQACFTFHHTQDDIFSETLEIWAQSTQCYECLPWKLALVKPRSSASLVVNTTYPTHFQVKSENNGLSLCNWTYHFGEFGQYSMNWSEGGCQKVLVDNPPANIYLPLLWMALIGVLLLIGWGLKCIIQERNNVCVWNRWLSPRRTSADDSETTMIVPSDPSSPVVSDQVSRNRIRCLDTFRGITILLMILVNYGGGGYWFLEHAPWNGLTVADIIYPCFVWLMGASCVLSINSRLRHAFRRRRIFLDILRRSVSMFVIGFLLNTLNNNNLQTLRIPGVLQRLAFVYLVVALIELFCLDPEDNQRYAWFSPIRDIVCSWKQWIVVLVLAAVQLLITFLVPVPGCPLGYLGPGGLEGGAKYANCTGGAARLVDITLFGSDHIYQRPTPRRIYDTTVPYDPEGLLGSFTCVLTGYLGAQATKILLVFPANNQRIFRWLIWSVLMALAGGALCSFTVNDGPIPINKNLWSLSYVLVTSSIAFGFLTVLYVFIDVLSWWSGAPFRYAGMNALLLYVGHIIARPLLPFSWTPLAPTHAALLAMNATASATWILISWILYRKRFFVTL